MKRYELDGYDYTIDESPGGEYIMYNDAMDEINKLIKERDEARNVAGELHICTKACKLRHNVDHPYFREKLPWSDNK